jgi:hypothetical protein
MFDFHYLKKQVDGLSAKPRVQCTCHVETGKDITGTDIE